jgi:hypothetical protein
VAALGGYRGTQDLWSFRVPEILVSLRDVAIIEWSESSNRLEGITAAPGRVRELHGLA